MEPRSITSRVIMWLVFTILMFLYTSYSANIVALLQSPSRKIRTLRDLFESRLKLGVDDTVYNHYFFTVSSLLWTHAMTDAVISQSLVAAPNGASAQKDIRAEDHESRWYHEFPQFPRRHSARSRGFVRIPCGEKRWLSADQRNVLRGREMRTAGHIVFPND